MRRAIPVLVIVACAPVVQAQVATTEITVDFGAPRTVTSASGLLHGLSKTSPPPDQVAPLDPHYFRLSDQSVDNVFDTFGALVSRIRSIAPGATIDLLLGNYWGYPVNNWHGVNRPPWEDWDAYERFIRNTIRSVRDSTGLFSDPAVAPIVEVWNEPDLSVYWTGTRAQFFELYRRTYAIVRQELGPGALIAGPSFSAYNKAGVQTFLDYCLANACEVNALTWHALADSPEGLADVPPSVRDARAAFLGNARYAPLRIQRIDLSEIVGSIYTHQPAGTLAHYDAFEKSGADAAGRGCWSDSGRQSECFNWTLDGLLTAGSFQPRSVWWAHRAYADGVASRVDSTWTGSDTVALASRATAGTQSPQILVGHIDFAKTRSSSAGILQARLTLKSLNTIPALADASTAPILVDRLPATGEAALPAPIPVSQTVVRVDAGTVRMDLPALDVGEVARVTVCTYALGAAAASVEATAASGTVTVTPSEVSCRWAASSTDPWLSITGNTQGTGPGTIEYAVAPNDGDVRSGSFTIAGHTFTVNQASGLSPRDVPRSRPLVR